MQPCRILLLAKLSCSMMHNNNYCVEKCNVILILYTLIEMALVSKHNDKSKLVLLAKGNADLKCKGRDENVNALNAAYTLIDDRHFANSSTYIYSSKKWTDDYHSFEFSRTPNSVVVKVDGKIYDMDRPNFVGFDSIFSSQVKHILLKKIIVYIGNKMSIYYRNKKQYNILIYFIIYYNVIFRF